MKKCPAFCGTQRFITMLTIAHHVVPILSHTNQVHSCLVSLWQILILSTYLCIIFWMVYFLQVFPPKPYFFQVSCNCFYLVVQLRRLQIFQGPNLTSNFYWIGFCNHPSKSVSCITFHNVLFLYTKRCLSLAQCPSWWTMPWRLLAIAYAVSHSYLYIWVPCPSTTWGCAWNDAKVPS